MDTSDNKTPKPVCNTYGGLPNSEIFDRFKEVIVECVDLAIAYEQDEKAATKNTTSLDLSKLKKIDAKDLKNSTEVPLDDDDDDVAITTKPPKAKYEYDDDGNLSIVSSPANDNLDSDDTFDENEIDESAKEFAKMFRDLSDEDLKKFDEMAKDEPKETEQPVEEKKDETKALVPVRCRRTVSKHNSKHFLTASERIRYLRLVNKHFHSMEGD